MRKQAIEVVGDGDAEWKSARGTVGTGGRGDGEGDRSK